MKYSTAYHLLDIRQTCHHFRPICTDEGSGVAEALEDVMVCNTIDWVAIAQGTRKVLHYKGSCDRVAKLVVIT